MATISFELRAEIENAPPDVLGKKNAFVENEVDALLGVVSNVPSSVLLGVYLSCYGAEDLTVSSGDSGANSGQHIQLKPSMPRPPGVKLKRLWF